MGEDGDLLQAKGPGGLPLHHQGPVQVLAGLDGHVDPPFQEGREEAFQDGVGGLGLGLVPTLSPRTSLVEPPRTKRLPGAMGKA